MSQSTDAPPASMSQPRETLQRMLGRLTGPIDRMVDCQASSFCRPLSLIAKARYVHYYGMESPLSPRLSRRGGVI